MQETLVQFLGWEDALEKEMVTHSSILARRIPMDRGAWQATVHGVTRVGHDLATKPLLFIKKVPGHCRDHGKPSRTGATFQVIWLSSKGPQPYGLFFSLSLHHDLI